MKKKIAEFEKQFKKTILVDKYEAICLIFRFVENTDKDEYLNYMSNEFNWKKYFRFRKYLLKKYGYFAHKIYSRQIIFQFVRPCRWLTLKLFKHIKGQSIDFFHKHLEYEKREQLKAMRPRAEEIFDNYGVYKEIGGILVDEKSQYTFACILMAFITMKYEYFEMANCKIETDYLPIDIFENEDLGCMVDCGGYDGDTALEMMTRYSRYIRSYYLIEPGFENINKAKEILKKYSVIKYIEAAVSNENGFAYFNENGESGRVSESGTKKVKTVMLDDVIPEKITHLKMDIEGSELAALRGCRNHIQNDMPNMSICAYHRPEDIRELIEYVLSINPKYHVYLRHYGDKYKEIVLYFCRK